MIASRLVVARRGRAGRTHPTPHNASDTATNTDDTRRLPIPPESLPAQHRPLPRRQHRPRQLQLTTMHQHAVGDGIREQSGGDRNIPRPDERRPDLRADPVEFGQRRRGRPRRRHAPAGRDEKQSTQAATSHPAPTDTTRRGVGRSPRRPATHTVAASRDGGASTPIAKSDTGTETGSGQRLPQVRVEHQRLRRLRHPHATAVPRGIDRAEASPGHRGWLATEHVPSRRPD